MIFIFLSSDPSIGSGTKSVLNKKAFTAEPTSSALSNRSFSQPCQSCWKRYCHSSEDRHSKTFLNFNTSISHFTWHNLQQWKWTFLCAYYLLDFSVWRIPFCTFKILARVQVDTLGSPLGTSYPYNTYELGVGLLFIFWAKWGARVLISSSHS